MNRKQMMTFFVLTLTASLPAQAGTIIKLGFSTDSLPDIELVDNTISTVDDGVGATTGDQNTELTYLGVLGGGTPIEGATASFTLDNVQLSGQPMTFNTTILQATAGGDFSLYDQNNVLLLEGTLGAGTLSGPMGGTATGGFLTTEFGDFTSGTLLPALQLQPRSTFSVSLTDVNNGLGFDKTDGGDLAPFVADGTANIGAQIPEPAALLMLIPGILLCLRLWRHESR
jgi:hypothetical protein